MSLLNLIEFTQDQKISIALLRDWSGKQFEYL